MNVVDSSGWLEYFADGPGAPFFAPPLESGEPLLVPTICLLEVGKVVRRERGEHAAFLALAQMEQARVIPLDAHLAKLAAALGLVHKLPLADSIVLATGRLHGATVWTQDSDFEGLDGVRYHPKV